MNNSREKVYTEVSSPSLKKCLKERNSNIFNPNSKRDKGFRERNINFDPLIIEPRSRKNTIGAESAGLPLQENEGRTPQLQQRNQALNSNNIRTLKSQETSPSPSKNSISKYSRKLIPIFRGVYLQRKSTSRRRTKTLEGITLKDLLFKHKLDRFIKNIRAHSGLNDVSKLTSEKLKVIDDQGASENEILNEKAYTELQRKKHQIQKEKAGLTGRKKYYERVKNNVRNMWRLCVHYTRIWGKSFSSIFEENIPVFKPFGSFRIGWDILTLVLTVWNVYSLTLILSFGISLQESFSLWIPLLKSDKFIEVFEALCFAIYLIDIIVKFNTSIFRDGEAVADRSKIFKSYVKSTFFFDVLGTLAFWSKFFGVAELDGKHMYFLFFKLYPLKISINHFTDALINIHSKLESFYQMFMLVAKNLIVLHIFACIWHLQAREGGLRNSWIINQNLEGTYWAERYLRSLYFIVVTMTTVGYGDISPSNNIEYVVAMACMLIGSGMIGYTINSIGAILKKKNKSETEFRNKLQIINNYFKKNKVDEELKHKVRKYLEYTWKAENAANEKKCEEILKELPSSIRQELLTQSRVGALQKSFAGSFKASTLSRLVGYFTPIHYSKEEWIFQEGDIDDNLLIIASGSVDLILNEGKSDKRKYIKLASKQEGEMIGLTSFLLESPKGCSAKAASVCSVFKLSKAKFMEVIRESSEEYESYCMLRDKVLLYNDMSSIGRKCRSCGDINHTIRFCPHLSYLPFKDILIKKYLYSTQQPRRHYKRYPRQKMQSYQTLVKVNDFREALARFQANNAQELDVLFEFYNGEMKECPELLRLPMPAEVNEENKENNHGEPKLKEEFSRDISFAKEEISAVNEKMSSLSLNIPFKKFEHWGPELKDYTKPEAEAEKNERNTNMLKFKTREFIPYTKQESSVRFADCSSPERLEDIRKMPVNDMLPASKALFNLASIVDEYSSFHSEEHLERREKYFVKHATNISNLKSEELIKNASVEPENKEDADAAKKKSKTTSQKAGSKAFYPMFSHDVDAVNIYSKYFPYNNVNRVLENFG